MITYNGPIGEAVEDPIDELLRERFFIKSES